MEKYYVITSEPQQFSDGSTIYKTWINNDNGGLCFLYSRKQFVNGDEVELGIRGDKNNRATVYIKG